MSDARTIARLHIDGPPTYDGGTFTLECSCGERFTDRSDQDAHVVYLAWSDHAEAAFEHDPAAARAARAWDAYRGIAPTRELVTEHAADAIADALLLLHIIGADTDAALAIARARADREAAR